MPSYYEYNGRYFYGPKEVTKWEYDTHKSLNARVAVINAEQAKSIPPPEQTLRTDDFSWYQKR